MSALAPVRFRDFPDWLGPILVKELRQGLKARGFVVSFTALQAIFVALLIYNALLYGRNGEHFDAKSLNAFFWIIVGFQLLFVMPLRGLNDLATERKANTLELIFMTGLTPWRITVGKWASLVFQSILFVLAVLPYGILRYFFGGVNLTEELLILAYMLMASGVLTAIAVAISGLPPFVRIAVTVLAIFGGFGALPSIFVMSRFASSFGVSSSSSDDMPFLVALFDVVLSVLVALAVGASTIAPPAENHAMRQRLLALAPLIPICAIRWISKNDAITMTQTGGFALLVAFTMFHNLAARQTLMRRYFEPFARWKRLGSILAMPFLPGAASAGVFLVLAMGALILSGQSAIGDRPQFLEFTAVMLMAGAVLLTGPVIWKAVRRQSRWATGEQILLLIISGLIAVFMLSLKADGSHFYPSVWAGLFPPVGFWLMFEQSSETGEWIGVALVSFLGYAVVLQMLNRRYWREAFVVFREMQRSRQADSAPKTSVQTVAE